MQLDDLTYVQNITPYWGRGHYLAHTSAGELVEVLVAEPRSESVTSLLSWAHMLERVTHPSIPRVKTIVHTDVKSFVVLSLQEGVSLSECIHQRSQDTGSLGRVDVLSIFHQLASTLAALNSFGLNHGNLTLDQIKLVGEGRLQLHGWAPLSGPSSFEMRAAEELKSLQSFLYLSMVGEFPPRHHSLTDEEAEMLSPIEKRRLIAWQTWYHAESREPTPNLSTSRLMLFNDPPRSAQEIVAELSPHVDLSLEALYYDLRQELKRRDELESSYRKHERLLDELDAVQRQLQTWLDHQREQLRESEQQSSTVEQLYNQVETLQGELERSGQLPFERAQGAQREVAPYISQSSTLLYDYATQDIELEETSVTFGDAVIQLKSRWDHMKLSSPLMSALHQSAQGSVGSEFKGDAELSIDEQLKRLNRAPASLLAELLKERDAGGGSMEAVFNSHHIDRDREEASLRFPRLFAAPPPGASSPQHGSPQHGAPQHGSPQNRLGYHSPQRDLGPKPTEMVTLTPYQSEIAPQHSEEFTSHFDSISRDEESVVEVFEPATAFSHRNFFFFLYFVTTVVFVWSIGRGSDIAPELNLLKNNSRVSASISPQEPQSHDMESSEEPRQESSDEESLIERPIDLRGGEGDSSAESAYILGEEGREVDDLEFDELESQESDQRPLQAPNEDNPTPPPFVGDAPKDMVFIPSGTTESGLDERARAKALNYCVFEPQYRRAARRTRERCKWLISKDSQASRTFKVKPFFMDIYEVSRRDYQRYCEEGGACQTKLEFAPSELDLPMVNVSMLEAMDYCRMHQKTLPTYAQWLFAARGDEQLVYPWGDASVRKSRELYRANYLSSRRQVGASMREIDGHTGAHAVRLNAELGLSPHGVAHLVGNVGEWVVKRKLRQGWVAGGGWRTPIWQLRTTFGTLQHKYAYRSDDVGFRCVRNLDETP